MYMDAFSYCMCYTAFMNKVSLDVFVQCSALTKLFHLSHM